MKNIEKYTNTKDALDAYNSLASKTVSFDAWLVCEYKEPHAPTLVEAAQEMTRTRESQWQYGHLSIVEKAVRNLSRAIEREKRKPVRNCDRPECATTKAAQDVWCNEDGGKTAYYEWLLAAATKGEKK